MSRPGNDDKRGESQSALRREMGIIPVGVYILAAFIFVAIPLVIFTMVSADFDQGRPSFLVVLSLFPGTILAFLTLMIGYVNRDAGRRGMNRILWTLLVIFVPNAIGFILYFILRNPIRTTCPQCGAVIEARSNYCPHCRYGFNPTCPQCKAAVKPADTFCANCGVQIRSANSGQN
jgi:hypothetical protein